MGQGWGRGCVKNIALVWGFMLTIRDENRSFSTARPSMHHLAADGRCGVYPANIGKTLSVNSRNDRPLMGAAIR